jgi:RNA ligase (TIGR02306 family)
VSDILGIVKCEYPTLGLGKLEPKGSLPSFLRKTDQERIQNLTRKFEKMKWMKWEVTEKYDGFSMTVYRFKHGDDDVKEGVCSRNLDLKIQTEENDAVNAYWEIAIREKLVEKLHEAGLNLALQGELVGAKIGPNIYKLAGRDFYLFDVYDIDRGCYFTPSERQAFAEKYGIKHVPVLFNDYEISPECTIAQLLKFAEGKSVLNGKTEREGLVFKWMGGKNHDGDHLKERDLLSLVKSFKAISNNYLIKIGD